MMNPSRTSILCHALLVLAVNSSPANSQTPARQDERTTPPTAERFRSQVERSELRERAIEMLTQLSLSTNPLVRANAIEGLHGAGKRAEDVIRAGLKDDNAGVRFAAAMTAGKLRLKSSAAFVEALLSDPDPRVRAGALYALWALGKQTDPTPLGEFLMDPDPRIRSEAARVVGLMGNQSALPMLKSAAAEADRRNRLMGTLGDQQAMLERLFQLQVAEAMTRLGDAGASDAIRAALYPSGREGLESCAFAAHLLGELREERAAAELVDLVEQATPETAGNQDIRQRSFVQPKEVRLAAATALAKMGFRDGTYVSQAYASDPDPATRVQVTFLHSASGRPADLASLATMMDDPDEMVRAAAAAGVLAAGARTQ